MIFVWSTCTLLFQFTWGACSLVDKLTRCWLLWKIWMLVLFWERTGNFELCSLHANYVLYSQCLPDRKLPVLYLMDSIMKNLQKSSYGSLFARNIVQTFTSVFEQVRMLFCCFKNIVFLNKYIHVINIRYHTFVINCILAL